MSVVGLGKLGACLAACLADRGFDVVGIDRDARVVETIREGRAPVVEPGLAEMIERNRGRLRVTLDMSAAADTEVVFVVVPTPSRPNGKFSMTEVEAAAGRIGDACRDGRYRVIVLVSTVLPGDVERYFVSVLERRSRLTVGVDLGVCYSPEFIALGSVIDGILSPDLQLIGESDSHAGDVLASVYARLRGPRPTVRTTVVNAELAKIALNTFVTMKITFANLVGEICERLAGADVDAVTNAIGLDPRVGTRYLRAGLGFGGPCFPRDDVAFAAVARSLGVPADLPEATAATNARIPERICAILARHVIPAAHVGIVGVAFKPGTPVVDGSQALRIAELLNERGYRLTLFDPLSRSMSPNLPPAVTFASTVDELVAAVDAVVVANALDAPTKWPVRSEDVIVIDCWRAWPHLAAAPGVTYVPLGRGPLVNAVH